jgi:hypothetical protein
MHWIRERTDWMLKFNRRKLGRVFPDDRYPGMWRSHCYLRTSYGRLTCRAASIGNMPRNLNAHSKLLVRAASRLVAYIVINSPIGNRSRSHGNH